MRSLQGLLILDEWACPLTYGPAELRDITKHIELIGPPQTCASIAASPEALSGAELIFSGWGGPRLDEAFLDAAQRLRAVFYAAGSLSGTLTDAVWARKIVVTSAVEANAVPVAEYALATTLFSLKHGWRLARHAREHHTFVPGARNAAPGSYGSTVGLVSLGAVGRRFLKLLKPFDLDVLVYDPFVSKSEARRLGVTLAPLEELFRRSDVVSLHTPHLLETEGLITGELLSSMRQGATFINTARALVVRQDEMIRVAAQRTDLQFVLDVTSPEPPEPQSPIYTLPNVVLTPHIAGSIGSECRRMGRYMVEELQRFVAGKPLRWAVTADSVRYTSHRPVPPAPKISVTLHAPSGQPAKV